MADRPQSAEMDGGPGFRVRKNTDRPDPAHVAAFRSFEGAMVSDLMNRLYTMRREIRPLLPCREPMVGPAVTVKVFPGDNLMVHASLDLAEPGDIVVVDAGSSPMNAVLGDMIVTKARHRGIAGFVVDGLVRDIERIEPLGLPVFGRGVTPVGPLHRGPGEVNYAIQCGGVVVFPGDLILGDADGVVVVPRTAVPELLQRCRLKSEAEAEYVAAVALGDFSNAWVTQALESGGCDFE